MAESWNELTNNQDTPLHEDPVYIIAEMACSHDGNPQLAETIIDGAGTAGADGIQFQVWQARDIMVPHHPAFEQLNKLEMTRAQWSGLASYVRSNYPLMEIVACVYDRKSVDFCQEIDVDAFKLHSADLSNPHMIRHVAQTGKRIDLSVGASTLDEIQQAIEWIRETSDTEIWLMYGYQSFPTPTDAIHLDFMMKLRELFERPVGYQDHSDANSDAAFWLPAAAVGMGVDILEKHITHDRSKKGADHEAALNPEEFQRFVSMVREIEAAKGLSIPRPFSEKELDYRKYSKKSIVAARDLAKGTRVRHEDLLFMRAEDLGLPPDQAHRILDKTLKRDVSAFYRIREEDVS